MPTNFNLNNSIFSVSDISDSIKRLVEQNFSSIKIKGEIFQPLRVPCTAWACGQSYLPL